MEAHEIFEKVDHVYRWLASDFDLTFTGLEWQQILGALQYQEERFAAVIPKDASAKQDQNRNLQQIAYMIQKIKALEPEGLFEVGLPMKSTTPLSTSTTVSTSTEEKEAPTTTTSV